MNRQVLGKAHPSGILFEEDDPAAFVAVSKTKDGRYMLISSTSKTSSEVCRKSCASTGAQQRRSEPG